MYDWAQEQYPQAEIIIMGHSYGAGVAAYLASVRQCKTLVLAAGYRDISSSHKLILGQLRNFIMPKININTMFCILSQLLIFCFIVLCLSAPQLVIHSGLIVHQRIMTTALNQSARMEYCNIPTKSARR